MAAAIILIILAVLAVILLLPLRVKGDYGGGAWHVAVYYAWIRVFHKESAPKPPPDLTPPKPDEDIAEGQLVEIQPLGQAAAAEPAEPEPIPEESAEPAEPEPIAEESAEPAEDESQADEPVSFTEEAAPETEETPEKPKKQSYFRWLRPHSLGSILGLVEDGCAALTPGVRSLTKHLRFRHVKLRLTVASDDPAKTAKQYGAICAAFYNLHAQLSCIFDIEADELRILSDFSSEKMDFSAALELRCSPAALILVVLIIGIKFLARSYPRYRREIKEKKLIEQETAPLPADHHAA